MSIEAKRNIEEAIKKFKEPNLFENGINLFKVLGYKTQRQLRLPDNTFRGFENEFPTVKTKVNPIRSLINDWEKIELLFQLTQNEMTRQSFLFDTGKVDNTIIEAYLFFAIELRESNYTRTDLSNITRDINKVFSMPVLVLFKYDSKITLSVIKRRLHKSDESKDVLEKVTLIKDINVEDPHRAHLEILYDLSFDKLQAAFKVKNFVELHNAWQKTLDTKELNKRFYDELFKWYLWAVKNVEFPQIRPKEDLIPNEAHQSESVIRLLTRLLFCWFMKEKQNLVPKTLFVENEAKQLLKNFNPADKKSSIYYRAILQNLFFATLSVPIEDRKYIRESFKGSNINHGNQYVFRYQDEFADPKENLKLFKDIPFLNGGLFDSLDKRKDEENPEEIRLDGFSSTKKKQAFVPDFIFWGRHEGIDLTKELDSARKSNETVHGIFDILNSYKFTIEENTPVEEEIALDPDLLGRTFENLLASYNPETKKNARKQTGSFYTPREIVSYMVDESLLSYLIENVQSVSRAKLTELISYSDKEVDFSNTEKKLIITAIENLNVFDPACGSGAFPMGILHKLVWILHKVDKENDVWFESLINRLPAYARAEMRNKLKGENWNYLRKLGLIQQSIYGVDIQPIAIQIAKLRFFISLLVDQKIRDTPANNYGLLPLPNLDFKLVCANALIAPPEENQGGSIQFLDVFSEKFKKETEKYFNTFLPREKKETIDLIKKLVNQKVEQKVGEVESLFRSNDERITSALKIKNKNLIKWKEWEIKLWRTYTNLFKNESVGFFGTKYFFPEVKNGFGIVISNPPYGADFSQDEKNYFKKAYNHQDYQPESFLLFIEKSFDFLKPSGVLSFIIPNTWLTNLKLVKIRKFLIGSNLILNISHYHKNVFEAVVDTEVVIFKKGFKKNNKITVFNHLESKQVEEISHIQDKWKERNGDVINIFSSEANEVIVERIKQNAKQLREYCEVITGMKPYQVGKGIPKQSQSVVKNRIFDSNAKIDNSYKKLLRGSDINKYSTDWDGKRWIKYGDWLAEPRYSARFDSDQKIVIRQTGDSLIATLDTEKFVCMNNLHVIQAKGRTNLKFILALLNSEILTFYFQYLNPETGEALAEVKKENVEKLLIKLPKDQSQFIIIVDYILLLKKQNKDSSFFERLLDAMVDELYLPEVIQNAKCEVLKHLNNLPELKQHEDEENLKTIQKVYKELSDPKHPMTAALLRLLTVEEIKIIERRK
ncbi:MAG TPA: TaqI-like C-terminal specificity domain-containing protein [Hanamia sp.]|nr:TaqI-like C-terminal specificity domain-containing protein [Hanamia sp.]